MSQHRRLCCCSVCAPLTADEWENITKVNGGNPPYARHGNDANCDPIPCTDPDNVCAAHGFDNVPLELAGNVTGIDDCAGEEGDMVSQIIDNCYRKTGETVSFPRASPHCGMGWKGVQAMALWPGRYGFINSPACCGILTDEFAEPILDDDGNLQQKQSPIETKFTSISYSNTASASVTDVYGDPHNTTFDEQVSHSFSQTASTDDYGNVSRSGYKQSHHSWMDGIVPGGDYDRTDNCNGSWAAAFGFNPAPYSETVQLYGPTEDFTQVCHDTTPPPVNGVIPISEDQSDANLVQSLVMGEVTFESSTSDTEILYLYTGSSVYTATSTGNDEPNYGPVGSVYWTRTTSWTQEIRIALTGEYTYAQVIQDAKDMLATWDLTDDKVYPWRTDAKTWLQPYVSRDGISNEPTLAWAKYNPDGTPCTFDPETDTECPDCEFLQETLYTGTLRGAPMPAGYGNGGSNRGFFDFHHQNWPRRIIGTGACVACDASLGAWTPAEIPATATQWTNTALGSSMCGPGAHVMQILDYSYYNGSGKAPFDGIFMQKWCETQEQWPALNLARVCGHDRWLRNETEDYCIASFDGSALVLSQESGTLAGTVGLVFGGESGIYTVDSGSALNYVLTKLHDLNPEVSYDNAKTMRYHGAPGSCGENTFTAAQTDTNEITITTSRKHWLYVGETVTLTGISGNGTTIITTPDNNSFTVTGTLVGTGGTMGSANEWDTTCSRKQFVSREWQSTYRELALTAETDPEITSATFAATQHDYAYVANKPFVLVCSPNEDDVFDSGISFEFGSIGPDQCYGEEWHRDFVQVVPDPYWQNPGGSCGAGGGIGATSPCAGGDYPYPPLVEPMLEALPGAPTQPAAFYTATTAGMPSAVGAPYCVSEPRPRATVHNYREAWLSCEDWKDFANANCGSRGW